MNSFSKVGISLALISTLTFSAFAAEVTEVAVSTDSVFSENSCDQAFLRTPNAVVGDNISNMSDIWVNTGSVPQILYEEEQDIPRIIPLGGANWREVKVSDNVDFWTLTSDIQALFSEDEQGFILDAGSSVRWIESTLGSAYQLSSNTAPEGTNIGLIIYDTTVRNIIGGMPEIDPTVHRECVLIKSGAPSDTPAPTPEEPTELPQTGAEHILLALIALLLGTGLFFMTRKTA
ncbi:LPXTG cell wall anchor domain-containing protein [Candidatus Gracilibacteria bacterium]|nr:LPXTG cell wall anchor domain-containing protein [Candidatus Gracilibacteria bacterium]